MRKFPPRSARRRHRTAGAVSSPAPPSLFPAQDWSANPMFERKDNKKEALLDLDGRLVNLNKRYTAVKEAGLRIQAMVAVRSRGPSGAHLRGVGGRAGESAAMVPGGPRNSFENGRPPNGAWEAGFSCSGSAHLRPKGTLGHPAPHKTGADAGQLPTGPPRPSPWGQGLEGTRCVGFCWLSQGSGNGGGGGGGGGPGRARPVTACAGVSVAAH